MTVVTQPVISETSLQRGFRMMTGVLICVLVWISIMIGCISWLFAAFGSMWLFIGVDNATERSALWMALLMMLSPYAWIVLLLGAAIYIFRQKKPVAIAVFCVISLVLYVLAANAMLEGDWTILPLIALAPPLILVSGIAVAWQIRSHRK